MSELLDGYPLTIEVPVAWGEMDAFQHVNNAVYFRWFESARITYFRKIGMLETMERTGVGPILASTDCRFRLPLAYPDTITVGTRVSSLGEDRFVMDYAIASESFGKLAANGTGLIVTFDYQSNQKAPVPTETREQLLALEATCGNTPTPIPPKE